MTETPGDNAPCPAFSDASVREAILRPIPIGVSRWRVYECRKLRARLDPPTPGLVGEPRDDPKSLASSIMYRLRRGPSSGDMPSSCAIVRSASDNKTDP